LRANYAASTGGGWVRYDYTVVHRAHGTAPCLI